MPRIQEKQKKTKNSSSLDKINAYLSKLGRIPVAEKIFFVQHLAVMTKSGISLGAALNTLSRQTKNKRFKQILTQVSEEVAGGQTLAKSLKPHQKIFGELFINMIAAGEVSGQLEEVLRQLYLQIKKDHDLISKIKSALTYPAIIVIAMVVIGTLMLIFVVPKMLAVFMEMDAELPLATRALIATTNFLTNNLIWLAVVVFIIIFSFIAAVRTPRGKHFWHAILLKTPIMGGIIKKINLARFCRTFTSLLTTDIPIIQSLQITARVLGNARYKQALEEAAEKVQKGITLNEVLQAYPQLFPPVTIQMIAVGEETGKLDEILVELAAFYEEDVNRIMSTLPSIIEPVLILLLGAAVAALAVAIIMPMYSLTQQI